MCVVDLKIIVLTILYLNVIVLAKAGSPYSLREGPQHFEDFIDTYNKEYSSEEEKAMRYEIFLKNLEQINQLNKEDETAKYAVNENTDLTLEEFLAQHTCVKLPLENVENCRPVNQQTINKYKALEIPTSFDWREKHVVSRVKEQKQCGSCWAFSVVGNAESINAIKTGKLIELSEQQLVDCDKTCSGCLGGYPSKALRYLVENGAMSSESYPYIAEWNKCQYKSGDVVARFKYCISINGTEDFIAQQLIANGPLSIAIDGRPLHHYHSGILQSGCSNFRMLTHAVLLVGYGIENNVPYWIVKNSWGTEREEQGYFRMKRGVDCLGFSTHFQLPSSLVI